MEKYNEYFISCFDDKKYIKDKPFAINYLKQNNKFIHYLGGNYELQ